MSHQITLEIPDTLFRRAEQFAALHQCTPADALTEWLAATSADTEPVTSEYAVRSLPDATVLEMSEMQPSAAQESRMSELLEKQREGFLTVEERTNLDDLVEVYRAGLLLKSAALVEAVRRGLRPPIS